MKKNLDFTEGKIISPLLQFVLPVLFAMFLQVMYGAADLLIVGHFGTAADVSAVATGSHIMQTITSVIIGLSVGTTILVGQKIGQKQYEDAGNAIGSGICIFSVLAVAVTILMVLFTKPLCNVMNAPAEAYDSTALYVTICSLGSVFIIAYNLLGSIFRGMGDSKTPLIAVSIACVINIVLDLLFVGVFKMAASGAAIATVMAQAVSVFISILIIKNSKLPFTFTRKSIRFHKGLTSGTLKLGAPIALQDMLVSISFLAITAIVNTLGVVPSAGVGIAEKLAGFIMLVPSSFSQAVSSFVAQNYGAGKIDRAKKSLLTGILISFCFGVVMFYFSFFHGDLLASIFSKDKDVVFAAWDYMKAYSIDCMFTAVMFCMTGYFNGCGRTTFVMAQGIIGAFGVRIPVSYFMSKVQPISLFKVGMATPASTLLQILLCVLYYIYFSRKLKDMDLGNRFKESLS